VAGAEVGGWQQKAAGWLARKSADGGKRLLGSCCGSRRMVAKGCWVAGAEVGGWQQKAAGWLVRKSADGGKRLLGGWRGSRRSALAFFRCWSAELS